MRVSTTLFSGLLFFLAMNSLAQGVGRDAQTLIEELGLEESETAVRELPFWRKPEKIHIIARGSNDAERAMQMKEAQLAVGDVELVQIAYPIPDDVVEDAEVLIARCTPRIIREAENLRWLQDSRHGVNSCMVPEIQDKALHLKNICLAKAMRIDGLKWRDDYKKRLDCELRVIKEKKLEKYFLIIKEIVDYANMKMLVGCGRGSGAAAWPTSWPPASPRGGAAEGPATRPRR